jgi:hypothetical protein
VKRKVKAKKPRPGTLEPRRTDPEQVLRAYVANLEAWRRLP